DHLLPDPLRAVVGAGPLDRSGPGAAGRGADRVVGPGQHQGRHAPAPGGPGRRRPVTAQPAQVIARAAQDGLWLATAESLTAGAVVARLVDVPGASAAVAGGAACYSYRAKTRVLGVDAELLQRTGAVTAEAAAAMAEGA